MTFLLRQRCRLLYRYNKLCGMVTKLTSILKKLDPQDPFRIELTDQLLEKL
jgi:U3 small nucleolar ribonucleoprotein protein IMP3